ncbi:uncharacterized protein EDB91DRAFT_1281849 [Suillus paluster]|uniref:uncharacterized protein n=1 Tax=Suillus paluster TaxID=48578 RepID=UPI001B870318|nr:uncharacterized protein EDB91DRAFT_1281849 [Suillus paluster]KAG1740883.1 hypothetical protein EDB91DRAFT_1281849 [Suillus paluster]
MSHVMIAILNWQTINLEEIKIIDNSDKITMILPRVPTLMLSPDITTVIQNDPTPTPHPAYFRIRPCPFSHNHQGHVSHFRAILEPLARLASETEFRSHFEDSGVETWNIGVFKATVPSNIEIASASAFCLAACCAMDDLFKPGVVHTRMIWSPAAPWKANVDASVLLDYLNQVHRQPTYVNRLRRARLGTDLRNSIALASIFTLETTAAVVPCIIFAMEQTESPFIRHVGLKTAHVIREQLSNIIDDVRD